MDTRVPIKYANITCKARKAEASHKHTRRKNYEEKSYKYIVHSESFRSNAQITIAFARRNCHVSIAATNLRTFICICMRLRVLFAVDRVRVRAYNVIHVQCEIPFKEHQIKLRAHTYMYICVYIYIYIYLACGRQPQKCLFPCL